MSMFSKVSLFFGLNNLKDISLDPRYATICGYTENDLGRVFGPELDGLSREEIRTWYKGYHRRGGERVYNPYDVLLLLDGREFRPYWFETGSPTFLFQMLMEKSVSPMELENRMADMSFVSKFDLNDIGIEALLFQTGYLTIAEEQKDRIKTFFRLDYPNLEVRFSLNDQLLGFLGKTGREQQDQGREHCGLLEANDFERCADRLRSYLSGIPYQWHATGDLAPVRGLVREPPAHLLQSHRGGRSGGGRLEPWLCGHGGADGRAGVCAGVQDGGWGMQRGRRSGFGNQPDAGAGICGEVP